MTDTPSREDDPRVSRTRQHAIEAALELIAESGSQGCTFETVAERSGVARSTLYRHWSHKSELITEALESLSVELVAPDTGNLRDDMLTVMLSLGQALQHTTWGGMVAQLMAAAAIDPDVARIQQSASDSYLAFDSSIIKQAINRGEISADVDPEHAALLFSAPIFYRHLVRQTTDARWIAGHVDKTMGLLASSA